MAKVHKIVGVEDEVTRPSKSKKKRESTDINKFAGKLCDLTPKQLKKLDLPEEIVAEILKTIPMKADEARRRQVNRVGSLIRTREDWLEILALLK